jgi:hypothetical protein
MLPGTEVSTTYRWPYDSAHPDCWQQPHRGILLAENDPRAWAGSLAFPPAIGSTLLALFPTQTAVDAHIAQLAERGIPVTGRPVMYDFGVMWEITEKTMPYSVIYEKWVKARQEAYAERENSPMRGRRSPSWRVTPFWLE